MRSLAVRLFMVAALAIAAALTAVALLSRQVAHTEFRRFEMSEHQTRIHDAAAAMAARLAAESDPVRLDSLLAELGRAQGRELLLVGPGGRVLAASTAALRAATVTVGPDGRTEIEQEERRGPVMARSRTILRNPPSAVVRRPDGAAVGTLVMLRAGDSGLAAGGGAFGMAFDRRLLIAALAAGLVALALTWALSRRILEPVGALTAAARRLGRGDLGARVPIRSADELGELSRAFNAMASDLARQESLRRTLVSDVAHELRTPLTNLRCQIEAVEDGLLAPSAETVRSLRDEVLLLSRLVDDLQTLAVAEAGRLALDRSPVLLRDLVEGALESFRAAATERGVALRHDLADVPAVDADPTRIAQVLRNLLSNALRATPAGGTVEVAAHAREGSVAVEVRDTGEGIAPEHLPHVFERFYRADPSRSRATGGAGLGLAIVKGIVAAHGGDVAAERRPEGGTVVRFTLPVARP